VAERGGRKAVRRVALQALALVVGLGLLVWGADVLARVGAEAVVARNVQSATGSDTLPQVTLRGRFFLLQVVRGAYHEVDVTTQGLTSGPLRIDRVESRLTDVRVPFHDVLVQDVRQFAIGRSDEEVTLRYDDLNAYLVATGRPLTLTPAPGGLLDVAGSADVLGRQVEVRARVGLSADSGALHINPQEVSTGSITLGGAAQALLRQRLTLTVPLGTLPFGHELTAVTVAKDAVRVTASGTRIVVRP
jgi:DUF2993 family protein